MGAQLILGGSNLEHLGENLQCGGLADARFAIKGSHAIYPPHRNFKTEHIRLEIDLNIQREIVKGRSLTTFRAIVDSEARITLDAVNFQIKNVKWNGATARFTYKAGKLTILGKGKVSAKEKINVEISYQINKPALGVHFIKPSRHYPKKPTQVWTQGQDEFARYWFPCQDSPQERTTTEMIATVPFGFTAVSNGLLIKTEHKRKKTSTFHWKQEIPHATYLVTLAVGKFGVVKDQWNGIPVTYYCEKGRENDVRRTFGKTPKMINFFSKAIGVKYPYPKYAQVVAHDFIYGGMENTSATTQTEYAVLDKRASIDYDSDGLIAHELAHQWFGDYLTCKDWTHAWLNESFATYFDVLFKRHDLGDDEYYYAIRNNAEAYFEEDKNHYRRSIVTHIYKRPTDIFDRHLYEKGSVVLYMLHQMLRENLFWKCIHHYVEKFKTRTVETHDLINAIEETTGQNMRGFFNQWVFGAGHPQFSICWWWDGANKQVNLRVNQTQERTDEKNLFSVNTEFYFKSKSNQKTTAVEINKKSHLFKINFPEPPEMIIFDPGHKILKKVTFSLPEPMLIRQLKSAPHVLSRIEAAHALAPLKNESAMNALFGSILKDSFWGVQAEAAQALGSMGSEKAGELLLQSLTKVPHPKVRRAIYAGLKNIKVRKITEAVAKRFLKEESYFSEMEGLRALGMGPHPQAEKILKKALQKKSWNDVIRGAALDGLAALKSDKHVPILLKYTREGHHQRVRITAIRNLIPFAPGNELIRKRLLELTHDKFLLVQIMAVRALHQVGDERIVPHLKKLMTGDRDGRLIRLSEEAVNHIMKGISE